MFYFLADTGAMAVLALTCVKRDKTNSQNIMYKQDLEIIGGHIESLIRKILSQKKEDGLIGNIYSTGEAMQVSQRQRRESRRKEILNPLFLSP